MSDKRRITSSERDEAVTLRIRIPDYSGKSHPFSKGQHPEIYTRDGLKKVHMNDTARKDWFLKHVCTIREVIDNPVPFYFLTHEGELRSLDAGCVGSLVNIKEPLLQLNFGPLGFISSVEPTDKGLELSRPQMARLRSLIDAANA